jgi:hypothetical protein
MLLLYWLILFGWVTNSMSKTFGIPFLFLDPEYLGSVGFLSFFLMGFTTGAFITVFNISSYIINGYRFPFIATLSRPFMKYVLNNFIVPSIFLILYCWNIISFQMENQYQSGWAVVSNLMAFLAGVVIVILIGLTYFFQTNKDIILMFGVAASDADPNAPVAEHMDEKQILRNKKKRKTSMLYLREWRVDTYLSSPTTIKLVRRTGHYSREMLQSVFRQNHLNAAVVELIVFSMFILLGLFKDFKYFKLPAASSVMITFSMLIMISSALRFWLKSWATTFFIALLLLFNFFSGFGFFNSENKAYGLDYENEKANYNLDALKRLNDNNQQEKDFDHTIHILNSWRNKFSDTIKPKMVFINCSGGGLRASIWSYRIMQLADSLSGFKFSESSQLITGASGGVMGATYYRELLLRKKCGEALDPLSHNGLENIGKDLLNPVTFSITVSDLFFNLQRFKIRSTKYVKDRAFAFENQFNENTFKLMENKRLADYAPFEFNATIPMAIITPTIVNDGRRLLVSPQPIGYLTSHVKDSAFDFSPTIDAVEFRSLFKEQMADSLYFTSLLRMNATFPYILPAVSLPTEPSIKVMDAGIRDVTGLKTSLKFLHVFRDWIQENTSGVIFVDIRDSHKDRPIEKHSEPTFLENLITPLGNIYKNLLAIQDLNQDESYEYAKSWMKAPFDYVIFELPTKEKEISLNFHLTNKEKRSVEQSIYFPSNHESMNKLIHLLETNRLK